MRTTAIFMEVFEGLSFEPTYFVVALLSGCVHRGRRSCILRTIFRSSPRCGTGAHGGSDGG